MTTTNHDRRNKEKKRKERARLLVAVVAAVSCVQMFLIMLEATGKAIEACSDEIQSSEENRHRQAPGRLLRAAMLSPQECFWARVDAKADDQGFFHFLSLSRASFEELVGVCREELTTRSLRSGKKDPRHCDLKRRIASPRDIVAMTLKYLLSPGRQKDLFPHFGVLQSTYSEYCSLGMEVFMLVLAEHEYSRVYWDQSVAALQRNADRTKKFKAIRNVVGMIDGLKIATLNNKDFLLQNSDYNGWTKMCNRNCVLLWDTFGRIVDAAINLPGNFHDSKSTEWCGIYKHIADLPDGFVVVCDSAFTTKGELEGKLCKVQEKQPRLDGTDGGEEQEEQSEYSKALTHLRQCSEWGNNALKSVYGRLKMPLPTDNFRRASLLWCCIYLTNWRTSTCNRNQIKTYLDLLAKDD